MITSAPCRLLPGIFSGARFRGPYLGLQGMQISAGDDLHSFPPGNNACPPPLSFMVVPFSLFPSALVQNQVVRLL